MKTKVVRAGTSSVFLTAAILALGCSRDPQIPAGTIRGQWVSTFSSQFVDLVLEDQDGQLLGRAKLMPGNATAPYQVSGTIQGAELNATLRRDGAPTIKLRGTLRRDTLTAVFNGGEFSNRSVPLVRS